LLDVTPNERASAALWKNLMEEEFFFVYHLHVMREEFLKYPITERKWLIERFIQQKNKENEQMEAERRKAKAMARRKK